MPRAVALCFLGLAAPLVAQEPGPTEPPAPARPELRTPFMACPVAPIVARMPESGEAFHDLNLPPGEWLFRVGSADVDPLVWLQLPDGAEASEPEAGVHYTVANSARLSARAATRARLHVLASPDSVDALYSVSVHPVRPRPRWKLVSEQALELGPSFTVPTVDGPRCAAPVTALLRAGRRYRVRADCDTTDVQVRVPAQNGLLQLAGVDSVEGALALELDAETRRFSSEQQFVAPKDGLYLFWCVASTADFRARARCWIECSDLAEEGLFPDQIAQSGPTRESDPKLVVLWHRPDLWLVPADPAVFVPVPARAPASLVFASEDSEADFVIRSVEGVEFPVHVAPGSRESYTLTLLEGEPGVWLESKGSTGPIEFLVTTPLGVRTPESGTRSTQFLQLPVILRGRARAGARVSVIAQGGGCAPQVAMRGAGVLAQCTDPTGFSMVATTEGIATRDGEVEVLITASGAEPGAIAAVAVEGFVARPVGAALSLDLAELQWLSTPGRIALSNIGEWTDDDERLPSGTRVDWYRIAMKAGNVYRILASADASVDLILDVPGGVRRTPSGGVAIVRPGADGDATLGLAAPGVDALGRYAVQVWDLGPEVEREETP